MIEDIASLKQAMTQMDAEDHAVAEAAKDRAAHILGDSKLSFAKMAELIEQRRLLLRPKIVANIKRMDQPDMLGDAAFRDAGSALRREGQSFRQIAEAIELNSGPAPRLLEPVQATGALHQPEMENDLDAPAWLRALALAARIAFFPVRHPLRFFTVALLAFVLFNALRGFAGFGQQVSGFVDGVAGARQRVDKAISSISSLFDKPRQSQEAAVPPTSPAPIPSPSAAAPPPNPSAVPTTALASPATTSASPAPPSTGAPTVASPATPPLDPGGTSSKPEANDRSRTVRRSFEGLMPAGPRKSRLAGPCIGGVGGCYWGGGRY